MLSRRFLQSVIYRTMTIKAGDKLPSATLTLNNPGEKSDIKDLCKGKKTILVGVVGAFTPTCDNQIPAFVEKVADFKKKGVDQVACITVNDPFVTSQWGKFLKVSTLIFFSYGRKNLFVWQEAENFQPNQERIWIFSSISSS